VNELVKRKKLPEGAHWPKDRKIKDQAFNAVMVEYENRFAVDLFGKKFDDLSGAGRDAVYRAILQGQCNKK